METPEQMVDNYQAALGAADQQYVDGLKNMVNFYGFLSIMSASFTPLLWTMYMQNTTTLNTTGYKVGAYINLFSWGPYASAILLFWLSGSNEIFVDWLVSTMKFSVAGPWFFNFYAIYVIFKTGFTADSGTIQTAAAFSYVFYSTISMWAQFTVAPFVIEYSHRDAHLEANSYRDYEEPMQDEKDAPVMADDSYLNGPQEESGPWPTDEEHDVIKQQQQDDIDADPRPDTAKEFIVSP